MKDARKNSLCCAFVAATTALMTAACTSAPDCGSSSTLQQVEQALKDNRPPNDLMGFLLRTPSARALTGLREGYEGDVMAFAGEGRPYRLSNPAADKVVIAIYTKSTFKFDTIRMTNKDPATEAVQCVAKLQLTYPNNEGGASRDIVYKVEKTADGKPYTTVYGLY